jgi:HlyD family secretion protein
VVRAGDTIAQIAPNQDPLVIKAQVNTQDIKRIQSGQKVYLKLSACAYPDYGLLPAMVKEISPDYRPNQANAQSGYDITIHPDQFTLSHQNQTCHLQAGMEGQAEIVTHSETILQFFLRKARLISDL